MNVAFRQVCVLTLLGLVPLACAKKKLQAELDTVRAELAATQDRLGKSEAENDSLEAKIAELEEALAVSGAAIEALEAAGSATEEELAALRADRAKQEEELKTYQQLFTRLKKLIDSGRIKVAFRKGRMLVEMRSAVLFDSGKTYLKPDGQDALAELAAVLKTVEGRDFLVGGHTDDVPISNRRFHSNWELSTARAVVVVNYMIDNGFPAQHIGAAGYGEFDPVAPNDTPDGRAMNRRIEIVLVPNLGQIKGIKEALES